MYDTNKVRSFIKAIKGSDTAVVTWQVFFDPKPPHPQRKDLAAWWNNTLDGSIDFITGRQNDLCGVYMTINDTDGQGRKIENVTKFRAFFVDFDDQAEPEWAIPPHLIQKRDETHGHAFWLIDDDEYFKEDPTRWRNIQKRLSMFYSADGQIVDPCRVIRVPYTWHYKNPQDPKMYQVVVDYSTHGKYTIDQIINAHVLDAQADAELNQWIASRDGNQQGTGYDNSESEIRACTQWFANAAPPAIEGEGTHTVFKVAGYAHDRGVDADHAIPILWEHYNPRCLPPWGEHEKQHFEDVVRRAYQYATSAAGCKSYKAAFTAVPVTPPKSGWGEYKLEPPMTELERVQKTPLSEVIADSLTVEGKNIRPNREQATNLSAQLNAKSSSNLLAKVFDGTEYNGENYVTFSKQYFVYNSRSNRWEEESESLVRTNIAKFFDHYHPSASFVSNVIGSFRDITGIRDVRNGDWIGEGERDVSNMMVFQNGTVDVGVEHPQLEGHTRDFFNLNSLPYDYNTQASCPEWLKFLTSVWGNDQELKDQLQEFMGYCLVKDTSHQKFAVLVGKSRGGKGTVGDIIRHMVGPDNQMGMQLGTIIKDSAKAEMVKASVVNINDAHSVNTNIRDEVLSTFKAATGEDPIQYHKMYVGSKSEVCTAKFMIQTNNVPEFTDPSGALAARMLVFPFTKSFVGKEDIGLKARLKAEIEGIIQWSIVGLKRLRINGRFTEAASGKKEQDLIKQNMSPVALFIERKCKTGEGEKVKGLMLYNQYKAHMKERNGGDIRVMSYDRFERFLRDSDIKVTLEVENGEDVLYGIGLNHGASFSGNTVTPVTTPASPPSPNA